MKLDLQKILKELSAYREGKAVIEPKDIILPKITLQRLLSDRSGNDSSIKRDSRRYPLRSDDESLLRDHRPRCLRERLPNLLSD